MHDIREPILLEVDEIYNLACPAAPIHYQTYPIKTFECSVLGIINLLHLARDTGCRLLQASTSEVYGDPTVHPQTGKYRFYIIIPRGIPWKCQSYRSSIML